VQQQQGGFVLSQQRAILCVLFGNYVQSSGIVGLFRLCEIASVKFSDFLACLCDYLCGDSAVDDCIVEFTISHSFFLLSPFGEFGSLDYIYIIPQKWRFVKRFLKSFSKNFWWIIVVRGFCLGAPFAPTFWVYSLSS
jgi:hypothetical protein